MEEEKQVKKAVAFVASADHLTDLPASVKSIYKEYKKLPITSASAIFAKQQ